MVVVGGGFGGLRVTRALARADADITIVDQANHHLFQPLLYQVATGILPAGLIAPALRGVIRKQANARAVLAAVTHLDLDGRVVSSVTVKGPDGDRRIAGPHEDLGGRSAGRPLAAVLTTATGADTDRACRVAVHWVAGCPVRGLRG